MSGKKLERSLQLLKEKREEIMFEHLVIFPNSTPKPFYWASKADKSHSPRNWQKMSLCHPHRSSRAVEMTDWLWNQTGNLVQALAWNSWMWWPLPGRQMKSPMNRDQQLSLEQILMGRASAPPSPRSSPSLLHPALKLTKCALLNVKRSGWSANDLNGDNSPRQEGMMGL